MVTLSRAAGKGARSRPFRLNLRKSIRIVFYGVIRPLMLAALAAGFRGIRIRGGRRFPRDGPVILVANHPAAWADVVALDALLGRPLHFLAHAYQFRPWPRRVVVGMWGTLPVYDSDREAPAERNEETFRRCESLLGQGEVVAVFPEGVSCLDRGLMPFRAGAARLAIAYAAGEPERALALVPVGLHHSDRTDPWGDLTLSVGAPIPVPPLRSRDPSEAETEAEAVRLTARMREAVGSLIVDAPDPRVERLLRVLEPIAAGDGGSLRLEMAQRLANDLAARAAERPRDLEALEQSAVEWDRAREALGVPPRAFAPTRPRSRAVRTGQAWAAALAALPAFAGGVLHLVPVAITRAVSRRFRRAPHRVPFARMAAGLVSWTTVHTVCWIVARAGGMDRRGAAAVVLVCAVAALFAREYGARIRPAVERARLALLERARPDRARAARRHHDHLAAEVRALLTHRPEPSRRAVERRP